jgi:hypothetical protein
MSADIKYLDAVYKHYKCIFSPATAKKENKITRTRMAGNPAKNLYTFLTQYKYRLLAVQVWVGG